MEKRIGRPLRRTEWVQQCMEEHRAKIRQLQQERRNLAGKGSAAKRKQLQRETGEALKNLLALSRRLRTYQEENRTNPVPRRMVLRADSAFGTPEVFQRLLELGGDRRTFHETAPRGL